MAAVVPDVRAAAEIHGTITAVVESAAEQLPTSEAVLVGHSGSGLLLPLIAQAARDVITCLVFVDAHLPPTRQRVPLAEEEFREFLDTLTVGGRLPRWCDWWGADVMASLVPDERLRNDICIEMPRIPRDYFDQHVDVINGWTDLRCGYVRLSELYEEQAAAATELGWPVKRFSAGHLHALVDPGAVASAIHQVVESSG